MKKTSRMNEKREPSGGRDNRWFPVRNPSPPPSSTLLPPPPPSSSLSYWDWEILLLFVTLMKPVDQHLHFYFIYLFLFLFFWFSSSFSWLWKWPTVSWPRRSGLIAPLVVNCRVNHESIRLTTPHLKYFNGGCVLTLVVIIILRVDWSIEFRQQFNELIGQLSFWLMPMFANRSCSIGTAFKRFNGSFETVFWNLILKNGKIGQMSTKHYNGWP